MTKFWMKWISNLFESCCDNIKVFSLVNFRGSVFKFGVLTEHFIEIVIFIMRLHKVLCVILALWSISWLFLCLLLWTILLLQDIFHVEKSLFSNLNLLLQLFTFILHIVWIWWPSRFTYSFLVKTACSCNILCCLSYCTSTSPSWTWAKGCILSCNWLICVVCLWLVISLTLNWVNSRNHNLILVIHNTWCTGECSYWTSSHDALIYWDARKTLVDLISCHQTIILVRIWSGSWLIWYMFIDWHNTFSTSSSLLTIAF